MSVYRQFISIRDYSYSTSAKLSGKMTFLILNAPIHIQDRDDCVSIPLRGNAICNLFVSSE